MLGQLILVFGARPFEASTAPLSTGIPDMSQSLMKVLNEYKGIKYVNHLIKTLQEEYTVEID